MHTMDALASEVAAGHGLTPKQATAVVRTVFAALSAGIEAGGVTIAGFGKFLPVDRPARSVRNPRTGEVSMSKPSRKVSFRPAKALRDRLNGAGA